MIASRISAKHTSKADDLAKVLPKVKTAIPKWKESIWERSSIEPAMLRAPIMIILFIALWGVNVIIFERLRFQYHHVLSSKPQSLAFLFYSALFFAALYLIIMSSTSSYMELSVEIGVLIFYALSLVSVSVPGVPGQDGRASFFRLFYQVFFPFTSVSFAEVVLADVFTSLSKVFKDIATTLIVLYAMATKTEVVDHHDSGMILIAVFASLPFFLRIRQCLVQLWGAPDAAARVPITLNTLKYFSAFPPIWIAAYASLGYSHPQLSLYMTVFASINSLYSYAWDIFMDWGLIAFFRGKNALHQPPRRLIHIGLLFLACIVNLLLRFTWTANFFPYFASFHPASLVFMVEGVEVFRRWFWIIFRVEWEILVQTERGLLKDKHDDYDG